MELREAVFGRRSVRQFCAKEVEKKDIQQIIEWGMKAPSGKNGQPWKFAVVQHDKQLLQKIAYHSVYGGFMSKADCFICVFLDKTQSYNHIKDCQAVGACIQNMLLCATQVGLGACWIGEILNRDAQVKRLLGIGDSLDLMAVIALGYEEGKTAAVQKKDIKQCLLDWK